MYNVLKQEDYELSYSEFQDNEYSNISSSAYTTESESLRRKRITENGVEGLEEEEPAVTEETGYCFEHSFLYYYMIYSFQYVEKDQSKYRNVFTYRLFQVLRWIPILLTLFFLMLKIYLFHHFYGEEIKNLAVFKKIFTVFVEFLWIIKYALIHFSGFYLFWKHPLRTSVELKFLFERTKSKERLYRKLQKIQRSTNVVIKWTLISLIVPSVLVTFLPMFLEMVLRMEYPWKSWDIELLEILRLLYLRLISLPFLFYLIHISSLQCLHLEEYVEVITSSDNTDSMDEIFQKYLKIHALLQESVKNYRMYLRVIFGVIVTWGTIYAYVAIGLYKFMLVKHENTPHYTILAFDYFGGFVRGVIETTVLFFLPFLMLHRVEEKEKGLPSKMCEVSYSNMPTSFPLNSLQKILDFVRQMEKFQKNESIGYQVFGGKLSKIKTVWLITLSPLALHIVNSIIKGSL